MKPPAFVDCPGILSERLSPDMYSDIPGLEIFHGAPADEEGLIDRLRGRRHAMVSSGHLSRRVLDHCPELETVAHLCSRLEDHADLAAAARRNLRIECVGETGDRSVAEHMVTLALCALKHIGETDRALRRGDTALPRGEEIRGKVFGVLGDGRGSDETARLADALGATVMRWPERPGAMPEGTRWAALDEILATADILSVHPSQGNGTDSETITRFFDGIKPGMILVIAGRARAMDQAALIEALQSGRVAHLACEFGPELVADPASPLMTMGNVTCVSPSSWLTPSAVDRLLTSGFRLLARHIAIYGN